MPPAAAESLWVTTLNETKRVLILRALINANGSTLHAAKALGIWPQLVHYYVNAFGLRETTKIRARGGRRTQAGARRRVDLARAERLRQRRYPWELIAKRLGVSCNTLLRARARARKVVA